MGNIVATTLGKYTLPSLLSGHSLHPSQRQNTPLQDLPKVLSYYTVMITGSGSYLNSGCYLNQVHVQMRLLRYNALGTAPWVLFFLTWRLVNERASCLPLTRNISEGDRQRTIDVDTPRQKEEGMVAMQQSLAHSNSESSGTKVRKCCQFSWASIAPWIWFWAILLFPLNIGWVQWSGFLSLLPIHGVWGLKGLTSFTTISIPYSPSWHCFHQTVC